MSIDIRDQSLPEMQACIDGRWVDGEIACGAGYIEWFGKKGKRMGGIDR